MPVCYQSLSSVFDVLQVLARDNDNVQNREVQGWVARRFAETLQTGISDPSRDEGRKIVQMALIIRSDEFVYDQYVEIMRFLSHHSAIRS